MTLSNFTIKQNLAFGIMQSKKIHFSIYEIGTAFGSICITGRNRLAEMRKEWIKRQLKDPLKHLGDEISRGYEWNPKTRKYDILDPLFTLWMNAKYVSKIIS